jgi:CheY-specific phosphatase CheX
MRSNEAILDEALREAVVAVFAHTGVQLTPVGPSPALAIDGHDAVGVIGFTSPSVRGTLVLATTTGLVTLTIPELVGRPIPLRDRVRDWLGELSNLVLGRVKVDLSRYGVAVGLATPVTFTGEHLRLGAVQASRTRSWDFSSPHGDVRAWLEAELEPGLELAPVPDLAPDLASGEPILF